jgi:hypothetical protein
MELTPQDTEADARRIGAQVAAELEVTFTSTGFWIKVGGGEPTGGRAYVSIDPVRADVAARLVERLRALPPEYAPTLGALVVDTDQDRVGTVTGWDGRRVTLRPPAPGGGPEWKAAAFRPADANDELRARVAEANAAGQWGR